MKKMYRIYYSVDKNGAICNIYTYPILDEKNTYYVIQSGSNKKHIRKDRLGEISNVDIDRTTYVSFVIDLSNMDEIVQAMANKVKENSLLKIEKFQKIYEHSIPCECNMIEVETE